MEEVDSVALTILIDEIDALERTVQKKEQTIDQLTKNTAILTRMVKNIGERYVEDNPYYNPQEDSFQYQTFLESSSGRIILKAERRITESSFEMKQLKDQLSREYEELAILKRVHRKIKEEIK